MIEVEIPGRASFHLHHLSLDVNGTLALDGALLPGVVEKVDALKPLIEVHPITADTFGRQTEIDRALGIEATLLPADVSQVATKAAFARSLGADTVVAIGNGANDADLLRGSAIGLAVIGPEGAAGVAVAAADVVVGDILVALDLLRFPRRLAATLRI